MGTKKLSQFANESREIPNDDQCLSEALTLSQEPELIIDHLNKDLNLSQEEFTLVDQSETRFDNKLLNFTITSSHLWSRGSQYVIDQVN